LFSPAYLIARNVVPIIGDEPFEIWVMEKTVLNPNNRVFF